MVHVQHIEKDKQKKNSKETKRDKTGSGTSSHARYDEYGRARVLHVFSG